MNSASNAPILCRLFVDIYRCKACGACIELCPEVFYLDEVTEKAKERIDEVELSEALEQAVSICPTNCIELTC